MKRVAEVLMAVVFAQATLYGRDIWVTVYGVEGETLYGLTAARGRLLSPSWVESTLDETGHPTTRYYFQIAETELDSGRPWLDQKLAFTFKADTSEQRTSDWFVLAPDGGEEFFLESNSHFPNFLPPYIPFEADTDSLIVRDYLDVLSGQLTLGTNNNVSPGSQWMYYNPESHGALGGVGGGLLLNRISGNGNATWEWWIETRDSDYLAMQLRGGELQLGGGALTLNPETGIWWNGQPLLTQQSMSNLLSPYATISYVADSFLSRNPTMLSVGVGSSVLSNSSASALGANAVAHGSSALAAGEGASALGRSAIAMGTGAKALQAESVAIGMNSKANGTVGVLAIGDSAEALSSNASAFGFHAHAHGWESTALGHYALASTHTSTAVGAYSKALASRAAAFGVGSEAWGPASMALGFYSIARGYGQTVVGALNEDLPNTTSEDSSNPDSLVFVVGNGTVAEDGTLARSNALTIKRSGDTKINGSLRVSGVIRVPRAGDLSMGEFTTGPTPAE